MSDGALTFTPDPPPGPASRGLTFTPDPPAVPATGAATPLTFTPDPVPTMADAVMPVDRDLEGQRAQAMAMMPGPAVAPAEPQFTDPMSGLPMAALPSPVQTAAPMGDRDLEGQRAAAMADPISLGERFSLNAADAYYGGTLAGSAQLGELQRAARMTPQEWAEYNTAVRYAGGALKPLPTPEAAQAEIDRIAGVKRRYETIPGSGGPLELGTAIAGQLVGGLPSPESTISTVPGVGQAVGWASRAAPVIGRTVERAVGEGGRAVAGRILESGLSQGVVNAAADPLAQVGMIETGMQPGYDPLRTAIALPAGMVIGGALHGATEAAQAGVRAMLPTPPQTAWSIADRAAVEALAPTGQVYRTERPSDVYPVPTPPQPAAPVAEQPVVTAELGPAPTRSDATLTGPEVSPPAQPAPAAAAPALPAVSVPTERAVPSPSGPAVAIPRPGPAEPTLPARSTPASEAGLGPPAAVVEPSPLPPVPPWIAENRRLAVELANQLGVTEQVGEMARAGRTAAEISEALGGQLTVDQVRAVRDDLGLEAAGPLGTGFGPNIPRGEGVVDRPGAAAGRPRTETPVGEAGAPRVEPGPGEVPGGPRLGTDLGERPPDTQGAPPGTVAAEPAPRPTETPATEPTAPIREAPLTGRVEALPGEPATAPARRTALSGLTSEPDDVVPGQHVAKNPGGDVVGKGATPEEAIADAQRRGGAPYMEELPAARAPEDYRTLRPDISATEYGRRLVELRDSKPRPINKLWRNPETAPPERVEAARQALRDWNREYRLVNKAHGLALERDNAAFRARRGTAQLEDQAPVPVPGPEDRAAFPPPREAFPDVLGERNRAILDEQRAAAEARQAELSPAEQHGIRLNEEQQETGRITPADPTLEKLQATRDALTSKTRTPAEERKLDTITQQITRREAFLDRRGGVKQPFAGPPKVGREPDFLDYKFNNGTSVFRSVFAEAGYNPDTATSLPIEKQIPILTAYMEKKFGFSSVEVVGARGAPASRVHQKIQRDAMLDMTRAMHDLMASLGQPLEAASNHGTLRLVLAPAEPGRYGAYVADGTIQVKGGANSFGHEWIHAIDHILAERFTGNPRDMNKLLTQYGRDSGLDVTDNVQAAMAKLINTMFYEDAALAARHLALSVDAAKVDKAGNPTKRALAAQDQLERLEAGGSRLRIHASEFRTEARKLDAGRSKPYFPTVYEMLARAGEAWMSDKMRTNGVDPRGVVMPDEAYTNMVDRQLKLAYPKRDERSAIFKAYDDLFTAMKNEQILDRGKPAATVSNYGVSDPHHWPVTAPGLAGTGLAQTHQQTVNSYRNFTSRLLNELKLTDPNRPPPLPGQTWADKTKDFGRAYLYSYGSMMKVIIDRAPPEAQRILRPILDSLATAPGSGRWTPENFEEIVRDTAREWTRRYGNMVEAAGLDLRNMTATEGEQLRHGLVTGDTRMPDGTLIPANIQKLTGNVRQLLDEVWSRARNAGLDIGYAKNGFFPRIYDRYRAASDPAGFRRAAHELYSFMFDGEVKAPGTDPQALLEKWTTMPRESRQIQTNALSADPDLPTKMAELRQNLEAQQDPNITPAELARLQGEAQQLAIDAHDSLRGHIAEMNAASWHANLTGGGLADFDTGSPTGKFLQARILPPEADQIMAAYLHTDPSVAIPGYLHSVARRAAHADLFGANGERLTAATERLNRIDGMAGDDVSKFMELVADVTGRNQPGAWNRFRQQSHNVIQGAGALVMMERAVWSALTEPMVASMVTGNAGAGFRNMGYVLGQLIRTADARDRTALAEFLNVIASPQHDSVMLSRMGADVNDQPRLGRFLSNFYRATFLTQVTNGQRAGTVGTSNWFIGKLAQHFLDTGADTKTAHGREDAARWFRELGLPDEIHKDFAQFMVDQQGALPSPQLLLNHRFGDAYSLATRRLVDRIIQDPYKVDRAMMSGQPLTGLAFQLMSFNYSFQKNVLNPAAERILHQFSRGRGEAMAGPGGVGQVRGALRGLAATPGVLGATVAAGASMFAASLFTTIVRQLLYAPDQWNKHQEDGDLWPYLKDLAFSRSGLNGVVDPILQAFSHLKYDSDLTALIHGAAINTYMQNVQQVLQPILGTTDSKTNTALYNQARSLYNLVGVPLTASILTAASTVSGPIGKIVSGAALQGLTSPGAANWVARQLAGPKGATQPETAGAGGSAKLPGMGGMSGMSGMGKMGSGGAATDKSAGTAGGHAVAAGPIMGLIDDVAIPAMRYLGPMVSSLSPATKITAGIGAGAYGAYEFLKSTAPFRDQPAPEPKKSAVR